MIRGNIATLLIILWLLSLWLDATFSLLGFHVHLEDMCDKLCATSVSMHKHCINIDNGYTSQKFTHLEGIKQDSNTRMTPNNNIKPFIKQSLTTTIKGQRETHHGWRFLCQLWNWNWKSTLKMCAIQCVCVCYTLHKHTNGYTGKK